MHIGVYEVEALRKYSVFRIAKKLEINTDFKSCTEIMEDIKVVDSVAHDLLINFTNAYRKWYDFHRKVEKEGKLGDPSIHPELDEVIENRDKTRSQMVEYLK